ncbi:hypothetical protein GQ54DRAFT_298321 [Martensiomyces pterosporus]|nr:hypothetical protein GQ54DRAFT_298321 [Martensiomyces pterosporus]
MKLVIVHSLFVASLALTFAAPPGSTEGPSPSGELTARALDTSIPDSVLFSQPCLFNLAKSTDIKSKNYLDNCKTRGVWNSGYYINTDNGDVSLGDISKASTSFTDNGSGSAWTAAGNNRPNCDHILEADEVKTFFDSLATDTIISKYCWRGTPVAGTAGYNDFRSSALTSYYVISTLNAKNNFLTISQPINIDKNKFISGVTIHTAYQRANAVYQYLTTAKPHFDGTSAGIQNVLSQFLSSVDGIDAFGSTTETAFGNAIANAKSRYDNKGN